MASLAAMKISLFLLVTFLASLNTHARESQFFNKIPSTTNNVLVPNKETPNNQQEQELEQQPNFLPESENSYGLYGHESGQNPPSTVATPATTTAAEFKQPDHKYLPKNYNPVAYVTQPENVNETPSFTEETERSFTTNHDTTNNGAEQNYYNNQQQQQEGTEFRSFTANPNTNNNGAEQNYYNNQQQQEGAEFRSFTENPNSNNGAEQNYYNNQQQQQQQEGTEFRSYIPTAANNNRGNNYYYNGERSFNTQPQGKSGDAEFRSGATLTNRDNYFTNGGGATNSFQPQGMSDTRYMENGKYYYDINSEKYSSNHPYESLRGARAQNEFDNNKNLYGNNAYEFNGENSVGGFQNREDQFQDEVNMP